MRYIVLFLVLIGWKLSLAQELDNRIDSLSNVIEQGEANVDTYYYRSQALQEEGLLENALEDIEYCIANNTSVFKYHFTHALILEDLELYDRAIQSYGRALKLEPKSCSALVNRGSLNLVLFDDKKGALKDFNKCLKAHPDNIRALTNRAMVHLELGEFKKSNADLAKILRFDPEDKEAMIMMGYLFEDQQKLDSAVDWYDKVIGLDDQRIDGYLAKARLLGDIKMDVDGAIAVLDLFIELTPSSVEARLERARFNVDKERFRAAVRDVEYCILQEPSNSELYVIKGDYEYISENYHMAVISYTRAIELSVDDPNKDYFVYRALTYQKLGEKEKACEDFHAGATKNSDRSLLNMIESYCID